MMNLKKVKENHKVYPFKYGSILVHIFFYFKWEYLGQGSINWLRDKPISKQIFKMYMMLDGNKDDLFKIYFNRFREVMQRRENTLYSSIELYEWAMFL